MNINEEVALLQRIPLFAQVKPARLKLLAITAQRTVFAAGEELFHMGDAADAAYVIVEGSADVVVDTPDGEMVMARLEKNAFLGEIAILCDSPRTATVRAAEQLDTLRISKDLFFRMVREFPEVGIEVMRVLAMRLETAMATLTKIKGAPED